MIQKGSSIAGTPTAEYIQETLKFIVRDLRNLFKLLERKESEVNTGKYNELNLLWERASRLLTFMIKIFVKLAEFNKTTTSAAMPDYDEAIKIIENHNRIVQKGERNE